MKKILLVLLFFGITFLLISCKNDADSGENNDNNQNSTVDNGSNNNQGGTNDSDHTTSGGNNNQNPPKDDPDDNESNVGPSINNPEAKVDAFRLSGISDITGEERISQYYVYAPYDDTYEISAISDNIEGILLAKNGVLIKEDSTKLIVELEKDAVYELCITTTKANAKFEIEVKALNNLITYPYDVLGPLEETVPVETGADAKIEYLKRPGGTYIYSNNPELVPTSALNTGFLQTKDLTGEVFFTFEHANYSDTPFYLGYQLKNEGDTDVYVTVTNIGYQVGGSWFGQKAWYDFYNTSFKLPDGYLNPNGSVSSQYSGYDYAYSDYKPRVFQPITYRLPAGEHFYVIGGTTSDSYNRIDVGDTADRKVGTNLCTNGNVKFDVTGGAVTATFYCYTSTQEVENAPVVGYKLGGYAAQYGGTANHSGVIDSYITWAFDDATPATLPVTYSTSYSTSIPVKAYQELKMKDITYRELNSWMTHLNPSNDHYAIGSDLVEFSCVDEKGNSVVIDNKHADGSGSIANTANWMIEYQENYTLINRGSNTRTVTLYKKDGGTLAMLIRDSITGEVIDTYYTIGQAVTGYSFAYPVEVPANSTVQITLCYVLVACSYGNVTHWAKLS